jgi:hypothetical protein
MMQGAADAEIDSHARRFMQEIDRERHDAFLESHESLDLTVELKSIDTPTLYLELRNDPAEPRAASDVGVLLPQPEGEDRALFKRFVPDTRFLELNSFPMKLHRTDVGREVWQPALSFMTEHSTNGARALPSRA